MKKLLSCICALTVAVTSVGAVLASDAGPAEKQEYVSVIEGFETEESIGRTKAGVEYNFLEAMASADTSSYSLGKQALKIKFTKGHTEGLVKTMIGFEKSVSYKDTATEYIQLYVKNTAEIPIGMLDFGVNGFQVTEDNYQYTDNPEFWKDHPGAGWILAHDKKAAPALLYQNGEWVNAPLDEGVLEEGDKDYGRMIFSIPAKYEGLVRIPLTDTEKAVENALGLGMCFITRDAAIAGRSVTFDDIALVTTEDKSADKAYTTMKNYLDSAEMAYVKVLNGFEEQADIDNVKAGVEFNMLGLVASPDTASYGLGEQGLKVKLSKADPKDSLAKLIMETPGKMDLREADYFQFYLKNSADFAIGFLDFGVNGFVVTEENAKYTNDPEFWGAHLGAGYIMNHDPAAAPVLLYNNATGLWEPAPRGEASLPEGDSNMDRVIFSVPANFEGYVRVPLTEGEKIESLGIGATLITRNENAAGAALSFDDFAAVTKSDKSADKEYMSFGAYKEAVANKGSGEDPALESVKVITGFEESDKAVTVSHGINWVPYNFGTSTKYKRSGAQSYLAITNGEEAGMQPYSQFELEIEKGSGLANFKNADYIYMWAKNVSRSPVYIGSFGLTNVETADFTLEAGSDAVSLLQGTEYKTVEVKEHAAAQMAAFEIPANYEGYVRISTKEMAGLALNEVSVSHIKFFLINQDPKSALYLDDIAIHGTGLSAKDGVLTDPAVYFSNISGGIVDDYNETDFNQPEITDPTDPENPDLSFPEKTGVVMPVSVLVLTIVSGTALLIFRRRARS